MKNATRTNEPDAGAGNPTPLANEITDKHGYGRRWGVCARTLDNWLAAGLPHLKLSQRMVRIDIVAADAWLKEKFGTQRRAA